MISPLTITSLSINSIVTVIALYRIITAWAYGGGSVFNWSLAGITGSMCVLAIAVVLLTSILQVVSTSPILSWMYLAPQWATTTLLIALYVSLSKSFLNMTEVKATKPSLWIYVIILITCAGVMAILVAAIPSSQYMFAATEAVLLLLHIAACIILAYSSNKLSWKTGSQVSATMKIAPGARERMYASISTVLTFSDVPTLQLYGVGTYSTTTQEDMRGSRRLSARMGSKESKDGGGGSKESTPVNSPVGSPRVSFDDASSTPGTSPHGSTLGITKRPAPMKRTGSFMIVSQFLMERQTIVLRFMCRVIRFATLESILLLGCVACCVACLVMQSFPVTELAQIMAARTLIQGISLFVLFDFSQSVYERRAGEKTRKNAAAAAALHVAMTVVPSVDGSTSHSKDKATPTPYQGPPRADKLEPELRAQISPWNFQPDGLAKDLDIHEVKTTRKTLVASRPQKLPQALLAELDFGETNVTEFLRSKSKPNLINTGRAGGGVTDEDSLLTTSPATPSTPPVGTSIRIAQVRARTMTASSTPQSEEISTESKYSSAVGGVDE